jgi:hypothetical protein
MVANMVFHEFAHEAVDGSSCCGESLKDIGALFVVVQGPQNCFQLPDYLLRAIDEIQLFPRHVRHFVDYPVGVWYQALGRYGTALRRLDYMQNILEKQKPPDRDQLLDRCRGRVL